MGGYEGGSLNNLVKAVGEKASFEVNCICGKKHFAANPATVNKERVENIREQILKGVRGYVLNEDASCIGYIVLFDQNFVVGCDCRSIENLEYQLTKYRKPIASYFKKLQSCEEEKENGVNIA